MRYTVSAVRGHDPHMWVLQCQELPGAISQTRRLSDAEELMREAIAFVGEVDPGSIEIDLQPELPGDVGSRIRDAQTASRQLAAAQRATAQLLREAAAELKADGFTGRDISAVLHVSPQRVSQLLASR